MQIFAHSYHAWITFTSDQTGNTYSIGTWDGSCGKIRGVNYNIELEGVRRRNWYVGRVSLSCHIDDKQESDLVNFIHSNNKWEYLYNCSNFAVDAWRAAGQMPLSNKTLLFIPTPSALAENIKKVPGHQIDAPLVPKNE